MRDELANLSQTYFFQLYDKIHVFHFELLEHVFGCHHIRQRLFHESFDDIIFIMLNGVVTI